MPQCHIITHLSFLQMIENIGNIAVNEKAIAAKDNVKVTYRRLILNCDVFFMNFKVTYTSIFPH